MSGDPETSFPYSSDLLVSICFVLYTLFDNFTKHDLAFKVRCSSIYVRGGGALRGAFPTSDKCRIQTCILLIIKRTLYHWNTLPPGYDPVLVCPGGRSNIYPQHLIICKIRLAKFESKVGSRRTTKIGNLVVLDIFGCPHFNTMLYTMCFKLPKLYLFVGKEKDENKEFVWKTIFKMFFPKYPVVRRTTRSQFLVILTSFLVVEDTRTCKFCYPENITLFYYPPEVRRGEYWGLGAFLLQYFPPIKM